MVGRSHDSKDRHSSKYILCGICNHELLPNRNHVSHVINAEVTIRRRKRKVPSVIRVNTFYIISVPTSHYITENMLVSKEIHQVMPAGVTIRRIVPTSHCLTESISVSNGFYHVISVEVTHVILSSLTELLEVRVKDICRYIKDTG